MPIEREALLAALRRATNPRGLRLFELVAELPADVDKRVRHRVRALVDELVDEGVLERTEGQRVRPVGWQPAAPVPPPSEPLGKEAVTGVIRVHPAGYGFVVRDDGEGDVFVPARFRGGALDGDRVALATWLGHKGTEGRVAAVLSRGRAKLSGILRVEGRARFLEADDPRIPGRVALVPGTVEGKPGQAVVAEIVEYLAVPDGPLVARTVHVLGDPDDPRTEVEKIIILSELPDEFPDEVAEAAAQAPARVRLEDEIDRVDLRDRAFLTIDPETARDFDDAMCVEDGPRSGLTRLWVAIADVSHYVRPGTALDREARIRGVSVYLPHRAIPMLPSPLSAGICSLNPEVDRCAMVARMDIDAHGHVVEARFQAAVIRSRARLDYGGVAAALGGDLRGPRARYADHLPQLRRMQELAHRLRAVRDARGSLDFDIPEPVVVLDEDDPRLVRDVRRSRALPEVKEAYRLVEDFMLAANEAVARYFVERGLDTLWRIHAVPKEERLEEFAELAQSFGVVFSPEDGRSPRKVRDFLATIHGKPMERALSFLLLRSLKQAVYDVENVGHFGLAAPEYLHFTSPIRRYPDLVVHRLLKNQLRAEGLPAGGVRYVEPPPRDELERQAVESSSHERRAMEAEREVVDMYRTFLMRDRVGEEYDGTVTGVTSFGIFVEIVDPFVEGLVRMERLGQDAGDRFVFDERTVRLVGKQSGRSFALGDAVRVRIENVSVPRRKIDLALVAHTESERPEPVREGTRKRRKRSEPRTKADEPRRRDERSTKEKPRRASAPPQATPKKRGPSPKPRKRS